MHADQLLYRLLDVPLVDTERDKYGWVREELRGATVAVIGTTIPWCCKRALLKQRSPTKEPY